MYKTLALLPFLLLGGRVVEAKPCLTCTPDTDNATDTTAETSFATVVSEITETNTVAVTTTETATRTTTGTETTTIVITSTIIPDFDPKTLRRTNVMVNPDLRRALGPLGKDLPPLRALPGRDSRRGLPLSIISASAAATVSLPAEQVTQTTQANSTVSLATTVTQIRTVAVTEVVSQTLTMPLTSTVDQTSINTAHETTTTGVVQTQATTVTTTVLPGPTSGILRASGSQFDGSYVKLSTDRLVTFKSQQAASNAFLDYFGQLHIGSLFGLTDTDGTSLLKFRIALDPEFAVDFYVTCASGSGTGLLTCTRERDGIVSPGQVYFQQCSSEVTGTSDGVFASSQKTLEGCTNFDFVMEEL
ncbi:uncharacterized protein PG986_004611 [Apiospora aurea]|uniref:Uncharacterized protein n=1 Tax=Apiospora aurea TaxID=335848 RepID=A0ABR1QNL1_9PEZI